MGSSRAALELTPAEECRPETGLHTAAGQASDPRALHWQAQQPAARTLPATRDWHPHCCRSDQRRGSTHLPAPGTCLPILSATAATPSAVLPAQSAATPAAAAVARTAPSSEAAAARSERGGVIQQAASVAIAAPLTADGGGFGADGGAVGWSWPRPGCAASFSSCGAATDTLDGRQEAVAAASPSPSSSPCSSNSASTSSCSSSRANQRHLRRWQQRQVWMPAGWQRAPLRTAEEDPWVTEAGVTEPQYGMAAISYDTSVPMESTPPPLHLASEPPQPLQPLPLSAQLQLQPQPQSQRGSPAATSQEHLGCRFQPLAPPPLPPGPTQSPQQQQRLTVPLRLAGLDRESDVALAAGALGHADHAVAPFRDRISPVVQLVRQSSAAPQPQPDGVASSGTCGPDAVMVDGPSAVAAGAQETLFPCAAGPGPAAEMGRAATDAESVEAAAQTWQVRQPTDANGCYDFGSGGGCGCGGRGGDGGYGSFVYGNEHGIAGANSCCLEWASPQQPSPQVLPPPPPQRQQCLAPPGDDRTCTPAGNRGAEWPLYESRGRRDGRCGGAGGGANSRTDDCDAPPSPPSGSTSRTAAAAAFTEGMQCGAAPSQPGDLEASGVVEAAGAAAEALPVSTPAAGAEGAGHSSRRKGRSGPKSRSSPFIGVSQYKRTGRWEAHIWDSGDGSGTGKGRQLHLGSFHTAKQAARAYDRAALCMRGDSAELNYPHSDYANDTVLQRLRGLSKRAMILAVRCTMDEQDEQPVQDQEQLHLQSSRRDDTASSAAAAAVAAAIAEVCASPAAMTGGPQAPPQLTPPPTQLQPQPSQSLAAAAAGEAAGAAGRRRRAPPDNGSPGAGGPGAPRVALMARTRPRRVVLRLPGGLSGGQVAPRTQPPPPLAAVAQSAASPLAPAPSAPQAVPLPLPPNVLVYPPGDQAQQQVPLTAMRAVSLRTGAAAFDFGAARAVKYEDAETTVGFIDTNGGPCATTGPMVPTASAAAAAAVAAAAAAGVDTLMLEVSASAPCLPTTSSQEALEVGAGSAQFQLPAAPAAAAAPTTTQWVQAAQQPVQPLEQELLQQGLSQAQWRAVQPQQWVQSELQLPVPLPQPKQQQSLPWQLEPHVVTAQPPAPHSQPSVCALQPVPEWNLMDIRREPGYPPAPPSPSSLPMLLATSAALLDESLALCGGVASGGGAPGGPRISPFAAQGSTNSQETGAPSAAIEQAATGRGVPVPGAAVGPQAGPNAVVDGQPSHGRPPGVSRRRAASGKAVVVTKEWLLQHRPHQRQQPHQLPCAPLIHRVIHKKHVARSSAIAGGTGAGVAAHSFRDAAARSAPHRTEAPASAGQPLSAPCKSAGVVAPLVSSEAGAQGGEGGARWPPRPNETDGGLASAAGGGYSPMPSTVQAPARGAFFGHPDARDVVAGRDYAVAAATSAAAATPALPEAGSPQQGAAADLCGLLQAYGSGTYRAGDVMRSVETLARSRTQSMPSPPQQPQAHPQPQQCPAASAALAPAEQQQPQPQAQQQQQQHKRLPPAIVHGSWAANEDDAGRIGAFREPSQGTTYDSAVQQAAEGAGAQSQRELIFRDWDETPEAHVGAGVRTAAAVAAAAAAAAATPAAAVGIEGSERKSDGRAGRGNESGSSPSADTAVQPDLFVRVPPESPAAAAAYAAQQQPHVQPPIPLTHGLVTSVGPAPPLIADRGAGPRLSGAASAPLPPVIDFGSLLAGVPLMPGPAQQAAPGPHFGAFHSFPSSPAGTAHLLPACAAAAGVGDAWRVWNLGPSLPPQAPQLQVQQQQMTMPESAFSAAVAAAVGAAPVPFAAPGLVSQTGSPLSPPPPPAPPPTPIQSGPMLTFPHMWPPPAALCAQPVGATSPVQQHEQLGHQPPLLPPLPLPLQPPLQPSQQDQFQPQAMAAPPGRPALALPGPPPLGPEAQVAGMAPAAPPAPAATQPAARTADSSMLPLPFLSSCGVGDSPRGHAVGSTLADFMEWVMTTEPAGQQQPAAPALGSSAGVPVVEKTAGSGDLSLSLSVAQGPVEAVGQTGFAAVEEPPELGLGEDAGMEQLESMGGEAEEAWAAAEAAAAAAVGAPAAAAAAAGAELQEPGPDLDLDMHLDLDLVPLDRYAAAATGDSGHPGVSSGAADGSAGIGLGGSWAGALQASPAAVPDASTPGPPLYRSLPLPPSPFTTPGNGAAGPPEERGNVARCGTTGPSGDVAMLGASLPDLGSLEELLAAEPERRGDNAVGN